MPRILPRLLAKVSSSSLSPWAPFRPLRGKRKSLYRPVPSHPSFHPSQYEKSILLDTSRPNPITNSRAYLRHKTPPSFPKPLRGDRRGGSDPHDHKEAIEHESRWWSSPYLRMLASPIRRCIITGRHLPSDFLIRLAAMRLPPALSPIVGKRQTIVQTIVPDGLQHSKFTARKSSKANYVLCSRAAVRALVDRTTKPRALMHANPHRLLADHVGHLLRLRALQELELMSDALDDSLRSERRPKHTRLLRRLTRTEWISLRSSHVIPHPNALAVLVVPPLRKDLTTGKRPEPSMSAAPLPYTPSPHLSPLPLCTLFPVRRPRWDTKTGDHILSQAQIPLYNGVSLFPIPQQRAALHALLLRLLGLERRLASRHNVLDIPCEETSENESLGGPTSDAFLLCSGREPVSTGDAAAVAVALWRVRMFEDAGKEDVLEGHRSGAWGRATRR